MSPSQPCIICGVDAHALRQELAAAHAEIARLSQLVYVDDQTNTLNRRGFLHALAERSAHCLRYQGGFALVLADLDGLKRINDTLGHPAGDRAIESIAALLRNNVRASDTVGRMGGDEFALLLWGATEEQARMRAADLARRAAGASPIVPESRGSTGEGSGPAPMTSLSFGVAVWRPDETTDQLYARADADLYAAKARRPAMGRQT